MEYCFSTLNLPTTHATDHAFSYIKELADRLVTLESQVQGSNQSGEGNLGAGYLSQHESPNQRRSEEFSPPPIPDNQRKRQFSAVSNDFGNYLPQRNPTSWSPSDPARHLPHPPPVTYASQAATQAIFKEPNYSTNGMPTELEWRGAPQQHSQPTFPGSSAPEILPTHVLDWDESVVDRYDSIERPFMTTKDYKIDILQLLPTHPPHI